MKEHLSKVIQNTKKQFIVSWSGGKDSCLACYYTMQEGHNLVSLVHMAFPEETGQTLPVHFIQTQADAIGAKIIVMPTTWRTYQQDFQTVLQTLLFKTSASINNCVYGDMDIEGPHWHDKTYGKMGINSLLPLLNINRKRMLLDFLRLGFKAIITIVDTRYLEANYLGKEITPSILDEFEEKGIDLCGETGEYHSAVIDGPIFNYPLRPQQGKIIKNGDYCALILN